MLGPLIRRRGRAGGDDGERGAAASEGDDVAGLAREHGRGRGGAHREACQRTDDRADNVGDDDVVTGGVGGLDVGERERRGGGAGEVCAVLAPLVGGGGGAGGGDGEGGGAAGLRDLREGLRGDAGRDVGEGRLRNRERKVDRGRRIVGGVADLGGADDDGAGGTGEGERVVAHRGGTGDEGEGHWEAGGRGGDEGEGAGGRELRGDRRRKGDRLREFAGGESDLGAEREIIDSKAVIAAGVVDVGPAEDESLAGSPGEAGDGNGGDHDAIDGEVTVEGGRGGGENGGGEIESRGGGEAAGGHGVEIDRPGGVGEGELVRDEGTAVAPLFAGVAERKRGEGLAGGIDK